ncbi:phospholipase/carboxylesterase [Metabacillus crassostreae]|uniref:alpha/beta hydrolase n=1 Tax=Metabacillus crassostreae TaxID=929098 RepID=UPI001955FDD6|nr:alpha/beta hydrolase [Metabacillus crassostreae]MBM7602243.1 phospholipase/carboxylesterase [Metabacillus crassostreae]
MEHIFKEGNDKQSPTLLLLHGTGGNERDLLPIAEMISPNSSVLSVRGNILENGMPRFFRRLAEGVFDEEDLIFRTKELHDFIEECSNQYQFDRNNVLAIGYSNGANIAASMMYHYQNALAGTILLHPMVPIREVELPNLANTPIFIGAGLNDPIIPKAETKELIDTLRAADGTVTEYWGEAGHQLTREEIEQAKQWYDGNF